jgi:hypothetical protein
MPDQATLDLMELERKAEDLKKERARRAAQERKLRDNYLELTMAVKRKYPGENRHETALRYIREAEAPGTTMMEKAKALVWRLEH